MPFYYTGCGGNNNNFGSRDACESDCPPKIGKKVILLFKNSITAWLILSQISISYSIIYN